MMMVGMNRCYVWDVFGMCLTYTVDDLLCDRKESPGGCL